MIPLIIQDQIYTIQNFQRSHIPLTNNWSGTFFAVSYSKPALVTKIYVLNEMILIIIVISSIRNCTSLAYIIKDDFTSLAWAIKDDLHAKKNKKAKKKNTWNI